MKAIYALLFSVFYINSFGQIDPGLAAELQLILENQIPNNGIGVAACVIMPDGSEWHGQAGLDGQGNQVTESTVFHVASITKCNVATCMMLMAEEGLVDLDASWDDYVDLDVTFNPAITIRQLISNTSGIHDYLEIAGAGDLIVADMNHFFTPTEILEDIVSPAPDFAPGTDFHYSSSNFVLAGHIIETITGNTLFEELRNRIWDPLGLEHSYGGAYDEYTEATGGVWWNFGQGLNNYSDEPTTSMLSFGYGAAGMVSTATDMAKFIRALLTGEIVSEEHLIEMHNFDSNSWDDWSAGYGMGIHHAINVGSDEVIGHDGYYTNMSSVFHSETSGFTIATTINSLGTWYGVHTPLYAAVSDYIATNVSEKKNTQVVSAFPNPADDLLQFEYETVGTQYSMRNAAGQILYTNVTHKPGIQKIEIADFEPGVYFLHLHESTDHVIRIVKR